MSNCVPQYIIASDKYNYYNMHRQFHFNHIPSCAYVFRAIQEFVQSRDCAVHSQNLETACQSQDCALGLCNLEIVRHQCAISRSRSTGEQSQDRISSIAYTIELFQFPLCTKVRNVRNELLQLCCHHQCQACILKPPHQGLLGSSPIRRNSLPLGLGTGAESSQTCGVFPFKASSSRRALNYLQLAQTLSSCQSITLANCTCAILRLHKRLIQSQDWLRNLEIGSQFLDSQNAQCNLEIAQIPRLRGTYAYVCMHVSQYVCVDSKRVKLLVSVSALECQDIETAIVRPYVCMYIHLQCIVLNISVCYKAVV